MKRLGIFAFYDRDGIVDDYVIYLLKGIRPYLSKLICYVNGWVTDAGKAILQEVCEEVLIRENKGFDISAYREGIHYALKEPGKWDEVVFLNTTVFGPVSSFEPVFTKMDGEDIDFWGMTRHKRTESIFVEGSGLDYIPEHIQSYFFAVRKRLLYDASFLQYWTDLGEISTYDDAVIKHEIVFTGHFADLGFRWDTYIEPSLEDDYYRYVLMSNPVHLLKTQKCPVIKRKSLLHTVPDQPLVPMAGRANALMEYLDRETDYDVRMIIENILRTEPIISYEESLFPMIYTEDLEEEQGDVPRVVGYFTVDTAEHVDHYLALLSSGLERIVFFSESDGITKQIKEKANTDQVTVLRGDSSLSFEVAKEETAQYILFSNCCFRNGNPSLKSGTAEYIFEMEELFKATDLMSDIPKIVSLLQNNDLIKVVVPVASQINAVIPREFRRKEAEVEKADFSAIRSASRTFLTSRETLADAIDTNPGLDSKAMGDHIDAVPATLSKIARGLTAIVWSKEIERSMALMYVPALRESNNWGRLMAKYDNARAFMEDFLIADDLKERIWFMLLSFFPRQRKELYRKNKEYLLDRNSFLKSKDYL